MQMQKLLHTGAAKVKKAPRRGLFACEKYRWSEYNTPDYVLLSSRNFKVLLHNWGISGVRNIARIRKYDYSSEPLFIVTGWLGTGMAARAWQSLLQLEFFAYFPPSGVKAGSKTLLALLTGLYAEECIGRAPAHDTRGKRYDSEVRPIGFWPHKGKGNDE